MSHVLIIEDEAALASALAILMQRLGHTASTAASAALGLQRLQQQRPDLVVLDIGLPDQSGLAALDRIRAHDATIPVLMVTAHGNLQNAVQARKGGAAAYLVKPLDLGELERTVRALLHDAVPTAAPAVPPPAPAAAPLLIGSSAAMQPAFTAIAHACASDAPVLITGPTGIGKSLTAQVIHLHSARQQGPFVTLSCASLPESLLEAELFGHEKGSFTGAIERRRGCFELAHGGTLLLDEIGEMPLPTQSKLLRVLEERKVRRLGSPQEVDVDVRVLAATNKNLQDEVAAGRFREDLYFRLNVFQVALPPLRVRMADLPLLADSMIRDLNQRHACKVSGVSAPAMAMLEVHSWPGNVRELRNVLERGVILAGEGLMQAHHISVGAAKATAPRQSDHGGTLEVHLPVGTTVDDAERALIEATLKHTGGNRTRAAALLGVSQKTLFNKLKEYGGGD